MEYAYRNHMLTDLFIHILIIVYKDEVESIKVKFVSIDFL